MLYGRPSHGHASYAEYDVMYVVYGEGVCVILSDVWVERVYCVWSDVCWDRRGKWRR